MKKIYVPYSCRSGYGLIKPLIRKLEEKYELTPYPHLSDIVIIVGDRREMLFPAFNAFLERKPLIHIYAGIKQNNGITHDDLIRHCITLLSDYQLVESPEAKKVVEELCESVGKAPNVHVVGITHLDDLELDFSKVPDEPYNLILYNPTTKIKEIFVAPNPDKAYATLPREQFLGLLSSCKHFISNSSAMIYEAPFFLKDDKIIPIGKRNRNRPKVKLCPGGTQNILNVLEEVVFK